MFAEIWVYFAFVLQGLSPAPPNERNTLTNNNNNNKRKIQKNPGNGRPARVLFKARICFQLVSLRKDRLRFKRLKDKEQENIGSIAVLEE